VTNNNVSSPLQAIMQDPALTPQEKARKIAEYMERKRQAQQAPQPSPVVDPEPEPTKEPDLTAEIIQLNLRDIAEQAEHTDDNTYTIVENYALDHPDVGGREIAVYALLARRCHHWLIYELFRLGWSLLVIRERCVLTQRFALLISLLPLARCWPGRRGTLPLGRTPSVDRDRRQFRPA
jgi:hypothetical protein